MYAFLCIMKGTVIGHRFQCNNSGMAGTEKLFMAYYDVRSNLYLCHLWVGFTLFDMGLTLQGPNKLRCPQQLHGWIN